jgi:glycosyltransferase involved in cell wall biosynthesis
MKKVLFITHDDTRTGAPILLLNLKKAVTIINTDLVVDFLIKNNNNQLITLFQKEGRVINLKDGKRGSLFDRIKQRVIPCSHSKKIEKKLKQIKLNSYDFILSNTITNGDILPIIRKLYKGKIVSYIHELEMASSFFTNNSHIEQLILSTDFYTYPSIAVKEFLKEKYKIDEEKLLYLPYYITGKSQESLKGFSGKDVNCFYVGGCGTTDWRKGIDFFLQVAFTIKKAQLPTPIQFVWKGAEQGLEYERIQYDIKRANLEDTVKIELSGNNMDDFWGSLDLFLLTSREDPFPLVVLEAASYKVPTIAFNGSGGATEFISNDAGKVVPYFNIQEMTDAIITYVNDRDDLANAGNKAFIRMTCEYMNVDYVNIYFNALRSRIIN